MTEYERGTIDGTCLEEGCDRPAFFPCGWCSAHEVQRLMDQVAAVRDLAQALVTGMGDEQTDQRPTGLRHQTISLPLTIEGTDRFCDVVMDVLTDPVCIAPGVVDPGIEATLSKGQFTVSWSQEVAS